MVELVFLGYGGGRYETVDQRFKTGGFRVHGQLRLHVDPGPGALLLSHQHGLDPLKLDGLVVTHCHPDHYTDAEVLIEAMTRYTTRKRGVLVASPSVLQGKGGFGPAISSYHQAQVERVVSMEPGDELELGDLRLEATPTRHTEPTTFGLRIHTPHGLVGYTNDTEYFEELGGLFEGSRVLIANVTRPRAMRIRGHLCTEDLLPLLKRTRPELVVLVHLGMLFLKYKPEREAERVKAETGVEVLPGYAGLRVNLGRELRVKRPAAQPSLEAFMG